MVKFIRDLTPSELLKFEQSPLFNSIQTDHLYSDSTVKYNFEYFGKDFTDYSVIVFHKTEPIFCFYAFSNSKTLDFFNFPIKLFTADIDSNIINDSFKELSNFLDAFLVKHDFDKIAFNENPFLIKKFFDFIQQSEINHLCVVNLSLSEENIKSNLRKSYKSLINWGARNIKTKLINHLNPDFEEFLKFRDFHFETSGRWTRNNETWLIQFDQISKNQGFLITGYYNGKLSSGTLVLHGKEIASYGVGVYDRNLMKEKLPISHYPIFQSIIHAKSIGLKKYNVGGIDVRSNTDSKLNEINNFKRGFSTNLYPELVYLATLKPVND